MTLRLDAQAHVSVQLSLADDQALSASSRASPEQRGCRGNTAALDQLRVRVVQLAEQAACLQGIPDNEPECCQVTPVKLLISVHASNGSCFAWIQVCAEFI